MKKRRKTERIYIYIRIPANRGTRWFDRFLPLRFESSLPAKGDPGTNEKPPSPRCRFSSPRIDRAGERSSGTPKEESRCKTWLRSNTIPPSSLERNCQQFFRPRRAKSSWKHAPLTLIRSPRIYLSTDSCVRACVRRSEAPTVALRPRILRNRESRCARFQPRIYERLRLRLRKDRGDTNLLETFSTRDARVRERERERDTKWRKVEENGPSVCCGNNGNGSDSFCLWRDSSSNRTVLLYPKADDKIGNDLIKNIRYIRASFVWDWTVWPWCFSSFFFFLVYSDGEENGKKWLSKENESSTRFDRRKWSWNAWKSVARDRIWAGGGGGRIGNDRVNGYVYIIQMTARLQEARIRRSETIIFAPFREPRASPCLLLMIIYRIPGKRTFRRRRKKYIQAFNGTSFHPPVFEVDLECLIIFSRLLLSLKKKKFPLRS